jgi:hypothetical protein
MVALRISELGVREPSGLSSALIHYIVLQCVYHYLPNDWTADQRSSEGPDHRLSGLFLRPEEFRRTRSQTVRIVSQTRGVQKDQITDCQDFFSDQRSSEGPDHRLSGLFLRPEEFRRTRSQTVRIVCEQNRL